MSRTSRKYGNVARLKIEDAPVCPAKSHLPAAPRDTEGFVDPRMIMSIVIDAVAPRPSPAVAVKQLFEDRRRIKIRG
jgi:hypothetical protein